MGRKRVIAYASRSLKKPERRYCVTRKELLAVVNFVEYFKPYLYGREFLLRTDHGSLRWLFNFREPEGQIARWLEILAPYKMKIEHRPGSKHRNADALSRRPCNQCGIYKDWENDQQQIVSAQLVEDGKELTRIQQDNADLQLVRSWIETGNIPRYSVVANQSRFVKSLWSQSNSLKIKNNVLLRIVKLDQLQEEVEQVIIPLSLRKTIFEALHDGPAGGHLGLKKTYDKVRQKYYWPGMKKDVDLYVKNCIQCNKRNRPSRTLRAPMQLVKVSEPMQRIAVDIMGPLPLTEQGNKYVLVVADYCTKWTEAFAMANMEAVTVADILVKEVIARFGVPGCIHSDQGTQFESTVFQNMCEILGIEKTRTSPYHPQCDGLVERFNGPWKACWPNT